MNDLVNHPSHYTHGDIECIDAIRAALGPAGFVSYCRGCQVKYNWRTGHKDDPAQEQAKAAWYANKAEETIRANPGILDPAPAHPRLGVALSALYEVRRDLLVANGKLAAAEQERDELKNKLTVALAQLEERYGTIKSLSEQIDGYKRCIDEREGQISRLYDAKIEMERERNAALQAQHESKTERDHFLLLLKAALVKLHTLEVPLGYTGCDVDVVKEVDVDGFTCHLRIAGRGGAR